MKYQMKKEFGRRKEETDEEREFKREMERLYDLRRAYSINPNCGLCRGQLKFLQKKIDRLEKSGVADKLRGERRWS